MNFLLDENFPKSAAEFLDGKGHQTIDLRGTEDEGSPDAKLVEIAANAGSVILTTDRDFYHTLRHQYPKHHGVVVIALKQPNRSAIIKRLEWFLEHFEDHQIPGRAFQLRDRTWVAQPPLVDGFGDEEQEGSS